MSFRGTRVVHHQCDPCVSEPIPMRKPPTGERVRENRTHGSEGGDGESRSRPLSDLEGLAIAYMVTVVQ